MQIRTRLGFLRTWRQDINSSYRKSYLYKFGDQYFAQCKKQDTCFYKLRVQKRFHVKLVLLQYNFFTAVFEMIRVVATCSH